MATATGNPANLPPPLVPPPRYPPPLNPIEEAIKILSGIKDNKKLEKLASEDNYAYQKELAHQGLLRAWLNYTLGSVDEYLMNVENSQITYIENPDYKDSLYNKIDTLNQNSSNRIHYLAFVIEPKLRMIQDAQHKLDKLKYFNKMKNDPNYFRCALDIENTIRYLMDSVKPHLNEFISLNGISNELNQPSLNQMIMMGGARKRKHHKRKHSKGSRKHSKRSRKHSKRSRKHSKGSRKHSKKSKKHSKKSREELENELRSLSGGSRQKKHKKSKNLSEEQSKSSSHTLVKKSKKSKRSKKSRSRSRNRSRSHSPQNVMNLTKIEY